MIDDLERRRQVELARDRERLSYQILREWRAAARWKFTDAELAAEVEKRLARLTDRSGAARQLSLPLEADQRRTSRETQREACRATRAQRIGLRERIRGLLETAGAEGMTRAAIAKRLEREVSSVCQAVKDLIDAGEACQPSKKLGDFGHPRAVVVLAKFVRRVAN